MQNQMSTIVGFGRYHIEAHPQLKTFATFYRHRSGWSPGSRDRERSVIHSSAKEVCETYVNGIMNHWSRNMGCNSRYGNIGIFLQTWHERKMPRWTSWQLWIPLRIESWREPS